jgi:hypothetical protein
MSSIKDIAASLKRIEKLLEMLVGAAKPVSDDADLMDTMEISKMAEVHPVTVTKIRAADNTFPMPVRRTATGKLLFSRPEIIEWVRLRNARRLIRRQLR